ncbi:choice-of-anchor M domain-containing protein [Corynebacterium epidermidicanis]|uniref:Actinobacterial surface-anchored protein domain n=1 Tax=Corynebacterium epidermidicanis TaxID=1050174 RepID=A0A0G3GZ20_9CORY|nr:choice-of-anchor M domain-containing protein [Corynebacterium epidermidicanis]AKK04097.1 actinobacterial surface-anchored protein domain [Corynebacterium epidermidicanis]
MLNRRFTGACLVTAMLTTSLFTTGPAVAQAPLTDPKLAQVVTAGESIASLGTPAVLDHGHADLGPVKTDNNLDFLVRDDSAETPTWRHLEDVVFQVHDRAQLALPEGKEFNFTGARPGDPVWVVPQTEAQGVVWLGWNTQHPSITTAADRGVTLEFLGAQGPGKFSLFLQAGGFAQPQVLWNSENPNVQQMWAELNTHTHANWVFTQPGVYQVAVRARVKQLDGSASESTKILKFAVGDGTSTAEAATAQWAGTPPEQRTTADQTSQEKPAQQSNRVLVPIAVGLGVLAVVLIGASVWLRRSAQSRRQQATRRVSGAK